MLKLDEKDVRAIATSRFSRAATKFLIGFPLGCCAALVLLAFLAGDYGIPPWLFFLPIIALIIGAIWFERKRKSAEKFLLEEWRKEE
jgi:4-hydroxybenzoate polyprenyltransferase